MPRLTNGLEQVFTNLGIVGSGYKLYFFATGTSTPVTTYSDDGLTIPNTNPIVLDAAGRSDTDIWGADLSIYRMVLGSPTSTISTVLTSPIVDADPVDTSSGNSIINLSPIPTAYWGMTAGTSTNYTLNPALVAIISYSNIQTFFADIHIACGANPTIDINNLGSVNLKKYNNQGSKVALIPGDLQTQRYLFINDGTDIVVSNSTPSLILSGSDNYVTLTSNAIDISSTVSNYYINATSPTTLNTINGGIEGQIICITIGSNYVNVNGNATGNIVLSGEVNATLYANGIDWIVLRRDNNNWVEISRSGYYNVSLLAQEQQPSGTGPAALVGGVTRVLNTMLYNTINGASLSSNQITLPPGTYKINANSPSWRTCNVQCYLYNVTTSTTILIGTSTQGQFGPSGYGSVVQSTIDGIFYNPSISVYELRTTQNNLGSSCTSGLTEIYSSVFLTKL